MKYQEITTDTFEKEVVGNRQSAVLVFGAEWSGNSEMMHSMMERVSEEFNSDIHFFKVDIEVQEKISKFFGVYKVPTMVMIKEGEVVDLVKGFIPARKVRQKIKDLFWENT